VGLLEFRRIRSVLARNCSKERPLVLIIESPQRVWRQLKSPAIRKGGWSWESKVSNSKKSIGREGEK